MYIFVKDNYQLSDTVVQQAVNQVVIYSITTASHHHYNWYTVHTVE